ncbi:class I SAM-dependent methyltransferase [Roseospira goensis]|uniref:Class I SAM-dependent methyltransferase n=1 Tax=Roseospira goensis TaxID=391922 RepID=A0A7W6S0Q7_9PROT|nr:DUF1698 domain-containing protein [Roseospira goensis]MBB4286567.1 hypothetical protein [Roseospira goensis]
MTLPRSTPALVRRAGRWGRRAAGRLFERLGPPPASGEAAGSGAFNALDAYVTDAPSDQNAVDLFKGQWFSRLPGDLVSGELGLFDDDRIRAFGDQIGGFAGKRVLELGPLEGGHAAMMHQAGAASIVSIEANTRAFLKCLIVKEVMGLERVRFLLGNFDPYLETAPAVDFVLASGVIYHAHNPVRTLVHLCRIAPAIGIWSHYYDAETMDRHHRGTFDMQPVALSFEGFEAQGYRLEYGDALKSRKFCGGLRPATHWMARASWFSLLDSLGFEFTVLDEQPDHVNGPAFTGIARRRDASAA